MKDAKLKAKQKASEVNRITKESDHWLRKTVMDAHKRIDSEIKELQKELEERCVFSDGKT